jgi:hypothetical protein
MVNDTNEGCRGVNMKKMRVKILRFFRLREKLRVKVVVVKGFMNEKKLRV